MENEFCIQLAGINIGVKVRFAVTRAICERYMTDEPPVTEIAVTHEDLQLEHSFYRRENPDGPRVRSSFLEQQALYRKIAELMPQRSTILFHGSVVAVDGSAYLFTAPSGTGKSTHTALWRQLFGSRAVMVNDDKPLLQLTDNGVLACGTPWNGKHGLGEPISVPLRAICLLQRGQTNRIEPTTAQQLLPFLMGQCYRPVDPDSLRQTLTLMDELCSRIRLYELHCNTDIEAAKIAFAAMAERN